MCTRMKLDFLYILFYRPAIFTILRLLCIDKLRGHAPTIEPLYVSLVMKVSSGIIL